MSPVLTLIDGDEFSPRRRYTGVPGLRIPETAALRSDLPIRVRATSGTSTTHFVDLRDGRNGLAILDDIDQRRSGSKIVVPDLVMDELLIPLELPRVANRMVG